ncbi:MAG: RagB/SusD family nutrient uptake outer membrane protein, partial [Sphingobacteriales bacterium]
RERNAYIWLKDTYGGETNIADWARPYESIFYANNVLHNYNKTARTSQNFRRLDYVKGWAYFIRAYYSYALVTTFCNSYEKATASKDLGIPLKLSASIDEIAPRATLEQSYTQIFEDLDSAKILIAPESATPTQKKNRPSLAGAFALEARILLSMREYERSERAADSCLNLYSKLIDFNGINPVNTYPFSNTNEETIFSTGVVTSSYPSMTSIYNNSTTINKDLISKYVEGDLRLQFLIKPQNGGHIMNGNFMGESLVPYSGLATDEIILIKSECLARRGDIVGAMTWVNRLLKNRIASSKFSPLTAQSPTEALNLVLLERRKELVKRGIRWTDLKRLNKEGANITLTRILNGVTYSLPPNDARYVFP